MKLRNRFERFCYKNRDKGIPNLMLYIVLGNAIVTILSMINTGVDLYSMLVFDKAAILRGEVWRLVTYIFTQSGFDLIGLLFLYFFYLLGRHVELSMGTCKFNLYYLCGILLMDVFAMIFCPLIPEHITSQQQQNMLISTISTYSQIPYYLHLSLLLTFATMYPDARFMIMFIIPIKGWVIAIIYLILVAISIINLSVPVFYFPHNLFPLVGIANYILFLGGDIVNIFPLSWRARFRRRPKKSKAKTVGTIPFPAKQSAPHVIDYTHRCTVCGRTDTTNPELEFRYCSRCQGYHCYCEEHINDHEHIQ